MTSGRAGRIHWLVAAIWLISLFTPQFVARHALAADKLWDEPKQGHFSDAFNWFGGVPGPNDVARFETTNSNLLQRSYLVQFDSDPINQQLVVEDDNVDFELSLGATRHTYTLTNQFVAVALGTVPNRSGNLTINRGTLNLPSKNPSSAADLEIAPVANASGVLTVGTGGFLDGSPDIFVGLNGNGTLDVNRGGDVTADQVRIGVNIGSTGKAKITGDGSSLFSNSLSVLRGELNVTAGADIGSAFGLIFDMATIDGNGSTWDVSTNLVVGIEGVGTLNVTGGGHVTSKRASVGPASLLSVPAVGQVNVASNLSGINSVLTVDGDMTIGGDRGTLLIQAGGIVDAGTTRLFRNGLLRLEGGVLKTPAIQIEGTPAEFSWIAGTLKVGAYSANLTVPNGGILAPPIRSVNGTKVMGDYSQQAAGATLAVEIGGPFQFTDYGVLHATGVAALGGTLQLNLTDGFVPTALNSFDILQADGGLTGAFVNVANGQRLVTSNGLGSFIVNYGPGNPNPNHVILSAFQVGGPAVIEKVWGIDTGGAASFGANWSGGMAPTSPNDAAAFAMVITANRTVTVDVPLSLRRMRFDDNNNYTIAGPQTITLAAPAPDAAAILVENANGNGAHTIGAPLVVASDLQIAQDSSQPLAIGGTLNNSAGRNITTSGTGGVMISGAQTHGAGATLVVAGGTLMLNTNAGSNAVRNLTINANSTTNFGSTQHLAALNVGAGATATVTPGGSKNVVVNGLTVTGGSTPTGKLDVTDNGVVVDYPSAGPNPESTIRAQIISGRGGSGLGKTWNGQGITSSAAANADPETRSIGYADNSTMPLGAYTNFRGEPVDATSILMAYTRTADANLDGVVNDDDVTVVSAAYAPGVPQPFWSLGDFDYNGFVDDDDVTLLGAFYDLSASPIAAIPEPSALLLIVAGSIAWLWRRSR